MNNTVKYSAYGEPGFPRTPIQTTHHKHCIAHAQLSRVLVGSVFSPISPLLEKCAASATHHPLAQMLVTLEWNFAYFLTHLLLRLLIGGTSCSRYHVQWYLGTLRSNIHCFSSFGCITIAFNYSWWLSIDHFLYMQLLRCSLFSTVSHSSWQQLKFT